MAQAALRKCAEPGCRALVRTHRCDRHKREQQRPEENRANSNERGYTYRWQKARMGYLAKQPLCVMCLANGVTEPATQVDHIVPHRGDQEKFWDRSNWQGLCASCHSTKTAQGG